MVSSVGPQMNMRLSTSVWGVAELKTDINGPSSLVQVRPERSAETQPLCKDTDVKPSRTRRQVVLRYQHTGWLHGLAEAYAKYGGVLFGLLLVVGLLCARTRDSRPLAAAGWAGIATFVALGVNQPITHLFHEARPYVTHPHVLLLVSRSADFSFRSDHTVMAGAVTAGLFLVSRRLGMVSAAAAVLMAFVRVYVAAHYPWDVAAGLVLGVTIAISSWLVLRRPLTALTDWLRRQPGLRVAFPATDQAVTANNPGGIRA